MGRQIIGIGTTPNDGTGDTLREGGDKINANFAELYGVTGIQNMIPIMAAGMTSRTTNGAELTEAETSGSLIMVPAMDFDAGTREHVQFMLPMPDGWDGGVCQAEFIWTASATGNVIWGIEGVVLGDSDALTIDFEAAVEVTDAVTTSGDLMLSARSAAFTLGSYGSAGDLGIFQIYRDAADAGDTLGSDARLIGIRLYLTTTDYEDS